MQQPFFVVVVEICGMHVVYIYADDNIDEIR